MLYGNRGKFLELYNALNDDSYDNPEDMVVTTLEKLRDLFYVTGIYSQLTRNKIKKRVSQKSGTLALVCQENVMVLL